MSYATKTELADYLQLVGAAITAEDTRLQAAVDVATDDINEWTQRNFTKESSATARLFAPRSHCLAVVDDFWDTASLIVQVDTGATGTYGTTWTLNTDFRLEPASGVVDGETGWPYYKLYLLANQYWPYTPYPALKVTAKWGWTAVPVKVKEACLERASEVFRMRGAPFGIVNSDQFGPMRVRQNEYARSLVRRYTRDPVLVG